MSRASAAATTKVGSGSALPQLHPPSGHLQGVFSSPAIVSNSASNGSIGSSPHTHSDVKGTSSTSSVSSVAGSASNPTIGASLVTKWESSAKLSDSISLRLANAAKLASERAIPEKVSFY